MADIARTIQTGNAQLHQQNMDIRQGRLEEQRQAMVYQQKADAITQSIMAVGGELNNEVSRANKVIDDITKQLNATGFESPDFKGDPNQVKTLHEAMGKAETARQAAIDKRSAFLESIASNDVLLGTMNKSSLYNKDIGQQLFNEGALSGMSEEQRTRVVGQLTEFGRAVAEYERRKAGELGIERETYLKTRGRLRAEEEFGDERFPTAPEKSMLTQIQYATNFPGEDKGAVEKWYLRDLASFYPRTKEMQDIDNDERKALMDVFGQWAPGSMKYDKQVDSLDTYLGYVEDAITGDAISSPVAVDILEKLREAAQSGEPRRVGAIINQLKGFLKPNLNPKPTAESGS